MARSFRLTEAEAPFSAQPVQGQAGLYRLYGLTVESPFALPEAMRAGPIGQLVGTDVTIREGPVPTALADPEKRYDYWEARKGDFLLHVPGIARFRMCDGKSITFQRLGLASDDAVRAFLLGSCLGAILHQRGTAALHAAGLVRGGRVFLICGRSGAGKSTTTAHLLSKGGGAMLCDDLAAIDVGAGFSVHPGLLHTRLDAAALGSIGRPTPGAPGAKDKWAISTADCFVDRPQRIGGVLAIERIAGDGEIALRRLRPAAALHALRKQSYRRSFTTRDRAQEILDVWAGLSDQVPVWQVTRPMGRDTMTQLAEAAERAIAASLEELGETVP